MIGFLSAQSDVTVPFLQGLKETGYVDGQNVAVHVFNPHAALACLPGLSQRLSIARH